MAHRFTGDAHEPPPRTTALGSLVHYVTHADPRNYQPANIAFDLLPPIEDLPRAIARDRQARRARQCDRALADLDRWLRETCRLGSHPAGPLATDQGLSTTDVLHG